MPYKWINRVLTIAPKYVIHSIMVGKEIGIGSVVMSV